MAKSIKVFVVEDHETVLDSLVQAAKLDDYRDVQIALTAMNEKDALKIASSQDFDVALVDMQLPIAAGEIRDIAAGLRVVRAIASRPGPPKILAISGVVGSSEFIISVIRAGAAGFILKGEAGLERIFNAIRDVYQGRKVFPEDVMHYAMMHDPKGSQLTDREMELWKLIAEGCSGDEIAEKMGLSINTIKRMTSDLYSKIGVRRRTQAVRKWDDEQQYGEFHDV